MNPLILETEEEKQIFKKGEGLTNTVALFCCVTMFSHFRPHVIPKRLYDSLLKVYPYPCVFSCAKK